VTVNKSNKKMVLNECGEIAFRQWWWLESQYPYVKSHEFIVMPNHIHGLPEIRKDDHHQDKISILQVGTGRDLSLPEGLKFPSKKIKPLSELVGAYKTTVSKQIHLLYSSNSILPPGEFQWQRSFYDQIVEDEKSYNAIRNYIRANPSHWDEDALNQKKDDMR
jgi:REP element-mobilizing transposase RayT